jgi:hypothetical protein
MFLITASLGSSADPWPQAVLNLRWRYELAPWSRPSQENLIAIREHLQIPSPYTLEAPSGMRTLLSPRDLLTAALILGLATVLTILGKPKLRRALGIGIALGWLTLLGITVSLDRPSLPFAVVKDESLLRTGNAVEYAPVDPRPVPRGAEVTVHGRRGGWAHVTVGTVTGWLPESSLLH